MHLPRLRLALAPLFVIALAFTGCNSAHFGRRPPSDLTLAEENYRLQAQKDKLQQELSLVKKDGESLRALLDKQSTRGASTPELVAQLNQATHELTALRADYARLQAERQRRQATPTRSDGELQSQLGATEEKLAAALRNYTQLQEENGRLRAEVEKKPAEISANRATSAGNDLSAFEAQLAELRTQVASLATERDSLRQQLAGMASSSGETGAADASGPNDTQAKLASALRSYTLLQNENDQLKAESEKIAAEKSAIEAQLAVTRDALPLAAQAQGLRDQLRQTQAQAAAMAADNANLKTRLALNAPAPSSPAPRSTPSTLNPVLNEARDLSTTPPARVHTIAAGDSLAKISRQYYGTPNRWTEILAANRDILQDERSLVIGRTLRIP